MENRIIKSFGLLVMLLQCLAVNAQSSYEFSLDIKKKGAPIQSTMYGLFFEDINFGADGGLYAELVKNRSFDFPQSLMGWYTFGNVEVKSDNSPFERNPNYVVLSTVGHPDKHSGIENEGFRGMGFVKDASYRFSVWAKSLNSTGEHKIRVEFITPQSNIIASAEVVINSNTWKKYDVVLNSKETEGKGKLRIFLASQGEVALEHISLFPVETYKNRENGLRKDLAQALAETNPGVFRFPGGCVVEGTDLETRYDWKKTIGPVENRPVNENRWHYTFTHRFFPDYFQSYGLGFYEYFLFSEDIGAEPLPVLNCGLVCQYQNSEEHCHVSIGELDSFVQDALDLIEFANGSVTSEWGSVRVSMGHPEPFNLKYIGIGNEQWGEEYTIRLEAFVTAIRSKYPEIKIIGSSGPAPDGKHFDYLWPEMKRLKVDLVDEHYYRKPDWFLANANRYDNYDRKAPAVFAGEYACHDYDSKGENNFYSALCEAAFMTGLERNADIVHMCTYAPLLAHVDAWQWKPDMIWFDNIRIMRTPNYYIQQMYAQNMGTHVMRLTMDGKPISGEDYLYASAVFDEVTNCYIIKVVNTSVDQKYVNVTLKGASKKHTYSLGESIQIQHNDLTVVNTLDAPLQVFPDQKKAVLSGNILQIESEKQSFGIYKVRINMN